MTPFGLRSPRLIDPGLQPEREEEPGHPCNPPGGGGGACRPLGPPGSASGEAPAQGPLPPVVTWRGWRRLACSPGRSRGEDTGPLLPGNPTCGASRRPGPHDKSARSGRAPSRHTQRQTPRSRPARPLIRTVPPTAAPPYPHPSLPARAASPPSCQGWRTRVALSSQTRPLTLLMPPSDWAVMVIPWQGPQMTQGSSLTCLPPAR